MSESKIPSRQTQQERAKEAEADNEKTIIDRAIIKAVKVFEDTINDSAAKPSERIRAAEQILTLAYGKGKEGLRTEDTGVDAARMVAEAIATAKTGGQRLDGSNPQVGDELPVREPRHQERNDVGTDNDSGE